MAEGEHFKLALEGSPNATVGLKRWVYVLAVNCQGKGTLLWPYQGPGGMFPMEGARLDEIPLPDSGFHVKAPLGTDTYLLLTTATQIAEPTMLEFKGVVQDRDGSRGAQSPLEELLDAASAGTRDAGRPTPTTWSIESVTVHSTSPEQDE
jgi:hypothetical protein